MLLWLQQRVILLLWLQKCLPRCYRDRTPFVLTPDMAYVINGGDKPTQKFQDFIDLCCEAFNVIRENSESLVTLLRLMTSSGVTGVTSQAIRYVKTALLPEQTNSEATASFTR